MPKQWYMNKVFKLCDRCETTRKQNCFALKIFCLDIRLIKKIQITAGLFGICIHIDMCGACVRVWCMCGVRMCILHYVQLRHTPPPPHTTHAHTTHIHTPHTHHTCTHHIHTHTHIHTPHTHTCTHLKL